MIDEPRDVIGEILVPGATIAVPFAFAARDFAGGTVAEKFVELLACDIFSNSLGSV